MPDPIRPATIPADLRVIAAAAFFASAGSNAEKLDAAIAAVLNAVAKDTAVVPEWGVKFTDPGRPPYVQQYRDKAEARQVRDEVRALSPSTVAVVVSRTITTRPWEEVREDGGREH
jgi:hypothetical protein